MNKVILIGRLTRDPEVRWTQGQESKCHSRWTLAVDRQFKSADGNQQTDFIPCDAWDKAAEFVSKYFRQGMKMCLEGSIRTGKYTDKDGKTVYTESVLASNIEFVEKKDDSSSDKSNTDSNGFMKIENSMEDELPFN